MENINLRLTESTCPTSTGSFQPNSTSASPLNDEKHKIKLETESKMEPSVLDLSCKRYESQGPITYSEKRALYKSTDKKINTEHCVNEEKKSPFGSRSYMVTPPSESNSPRNTEPIFRQINSTSDFAIPPYLVDSMPEPLNTSESTEAIPTARPNLVTAEERFQNLETIQTRPLDHRRIGLIAMPSEHPEIGKKIPRPFKAYPKDPLSLTMGTTQLICDQTSNEAYSEFRRKMLESVKKTNEGTNLKMRRTTKSPGLPTSTMDEKDAAYWERRRKNNEAAKRSRDARRAKEDEIAIRAAFLEQENIKLKYELAALRDETAKLRFRLVMEETPIENVRSSLNRNVIASHPS